VSDRPFRLIPGGVEAPKTKRTGLTQWECRACLANEGVLTRALVKVRYGAFTDPQLRITGGSDVWACAVCLARGRYTPVTA
jgi:hypothetical protein